MMDYGAIIVQSIYTAITAMLLFVVHHKVNSLELCDITLTSRITSPPPEVRPEILEVIDLFVLSHPF